MRLELECDFCGKKVYKYPSQVCRHNFCSRKCLANFSSREKNPELYNALKDYANMSGHMKKLNQEMNPSRMNFSTRAKLSMKKYGSGRGISYAKSFGRHTHRKVAERILGRKLRPGEVVHHLDGNKRNNAPENLVVFSSQSEHAKWHALQGGDAT